MATAVTLKESDGSEIYPVTDISLVNNGIHAVDIEATTPAPAVETAMIADGAVTNAKIDWSTIGTWGDAGYMDFGDIRVCWGYGITNSSQAPKSISFPASFSVAPRVIATANFYEAGSATWSVFVSGVTTSGFEIQGGFNTFSGGGSYYATGFDYIAIGKK